MTLSMGTSPLFSEQPGIKVEQAIRYRDGPPRVRFSEQRRRGNSRGFVAVKRRCR
jgi:hypothetical protein